MTAHYETDAVIVQNEQYIERYADVSKISEILGMLSKEDLMSMLFLLMDFIGCVDYLNIVKEAKEELRTYLLNLFLTRMEFVHHTFIVEIIGTLKKFHVLRKLNFCKHKFVERNRPDLLSGFWKSLHSICEEISDEELKPLNHFLFGPTDQSNSFEETVCKLFVSSRISKMDLQVLIDAFRHIRRVDLVQKVQVVLCDQRGQTTVHPVQNPVMKQASGLAIIVNQEVFNVSSDNTVNFPPRTGSEYDRDSLDRTWKGFGFHTQVYNNLNSADMITLFSEISGKCKENYGIFVACLLSHGHADVIYGSDGKPVRITELIHLVANKCQQFLDKPKLFFIQACQEYRRDSSDNGGGNLYSGFSWADVFLAVSTVKGNVSYRDISRGSLFISALVEELSLCGAKDDIHKIMTNVKKKVSMSHKNQMPIVHTTLRADVVFKKLY